MMEKIIQQNLSLIKASWQIYYQNFKTTILKMFKELKKDMEKVREMTCEQNGTINRDFKNLKRNQKEILGLKSTITELKNSLDRLKGRLRRQKNQRTLTSDQIRYCRVRLFATP